MVGASFGHTYVPPHGDQVGFSYGGEVTPPADHELEFLGILPAPSGAIALDAIALSVSGTLPAPSGSIALTIEVQLEAAGILPAPSGGITLSAPTAVISGTLPAPSGAIQILAPALLDISGTFPAPSGAIEILAPALLDIVGTFPAPTGKIELATSEISVAGTMPAPSGAISIAGEVLLQARGLLLPPVGRIALAEPSDISVGGTFGAPKGAVHIETIFVPEPQVEIRGTFGAPSGAVSLFYDAQLPSFMPVSIGASWRKGSKANTQHCGGFSDARRVHPQSCLPWQDAANNSAVIRQNWNHGASPAPQSANSWRGANRAASDIKEPWQQAARIQLHRNQHWRHGLVLSHATTATAQQSARVISGICAAFRGAGTVYLVLDTPMPLFMPRIGINPCVVWNRGTYTKLTPNYPKHPIDPTKPIEPPEWGNSDPILPRAYYMIVNTASLIRLPDGLELPVTSMAISTDFDSWCWSLSAELIGRDAWEAVKPNPLACEVEADINGLKWRFLLDVPNHQSEFNSNRVSIRGRSRSAWLNLPFARAMNRTETDARDMTQLAESALYQTGWTMDWQLPDWSVPAGRYSSNASAINALLRLVNTTNDGLYTHPSLQIITAQPRWPVPAWQLADAAAQYTIPDDVILSMSQSPIYTQPINGIYISGTTHGVTALVKIMYSDGSLLGEMISEDLICDSSGIAARQRGLNAISDSGAGFSFDAEMPLVDGLGLIPPGRIVLIGGQKGVSRSVSVSARWSGGLEVRQAVGFETREFA